MERKPVAAGSFYPSDPEELRDYIRELFLCKRGPGFLPDPNGFQKNVGLIVPHAGYVYSGATACHAYMEASNFGKPDLVVILGPNHTGLGKAISIWPMGAWITPLGKVKVDEEVSNSLSREFPSVSLDYEGHLMEHSIEVQIPFLQFTLGTGFKILPVCLGDQRKEVMFKLSKALGNSLKNRRFWMVSSTDLNHYENHETTLFKDKMVIDAIVNGNVDDLYDRISQNHITMCGYGAVAVQMYMNIGNVQLLSHSTSGEVSRDYEQEVGYMAACTC